MPVFNYRARDAGGKLISGKLDAPNRGIVADKLRQMKYFEIGSDKVLAKNAKNSAVLANTADNISSLRSTSAVLTAAVLASLAYSIQINAPGAAVQLVEGLGYTRDLIGMNSVFVLIRPPRGQ